MFSFLVNADGGLTTAGYAVCIVIGVALFIAALVFAGKVSEKKRMGTKQLVFCAMAMALAFITSYIKIFNMPWGGSVTLCSMLFIVLVGNWYGPKTGVLVGLVYGILQFIQEPYVLSFFQVCCDYILAFAALGRGGVFCKEQERPDQRLYRSGDRPGSVPCAWRLSLLDGLYAGELPEGALKCVPDPVQLQLSAGRGRDHSDHHLHPGSGERAEPGEEDRAGVKIS